MTLILSLVEKFEHALAAELNRAPTYLAGKRGIYSTYELAENAREIFSKELQAVIPQTAQNEFNLAGRALVFSLGTAAAMHMLRAIELTLRPYYEMFAGAVGKGERNYAAYLKKLGSLAEDEGQGFKPDKRVVQMLAQIKEHYRNPVVTAESSVSLDDALALFNMASALITLMAGQMREHKATGKKPAKAVSAEDGEDDEALYDLRLSQAG